MTRHLARALSAMLAILAVLGVVCLPPEHVHESGDHADGHEVVHRHLASHHEGEPGAAFDHQDDDAARYLSSPFTLPDAPPHLPPSDSSVLTIRPAVPGPGVPDRIVPSVHVVRVHDPPWASSTGLRAPPAFARHA